MNVQLRTFLLLFFAVTTTAFAQQSNCRDLRGCERKLCELQNKLDYAKQYGRTDQIRGLENAIQRVQKKCNSGSGAYAYDVDKKILEKEQKVQEKTVELNEAIRENQKPEKIEKRKRKLEEAKAELEAAKKEK